MKRACDGAVMLRRDLRHERDLTSVVKTARFESHFIFRLPEVPSGFIGCFVRVFLKCFSQIGV